MQNTQPIPSDQPALSPYLVVKGAPQAIRFYTEVFGAKELFRLCEPNGKVGHAELELAGSRILLAEEYPDFGAISPVTLGGTAVALHLYVANVDELVARAEKAGATVLRAVKDEFYGDRTGTIADPFGHKWHLASRKEDVSPQEMQKRMDAMFKS